MNKVRLSVYMRGERPILFRFDRALSLEALKSEILKRFKVAGATAHFHLLLLTGELVEEVGLLENNDRLLIESVYEAAAFEARRIQAHHQYYLKHSAQEFARANGAPPPKHNGFP